ncbi:hypothetical protein GCK72_007784 [Caenorhabditis remanei]|uniref:C2H2-type domain-containing protein n=1 Tax=Caenorhabditis remanei TaxID=31234 RepID=A0A6A5HJZ5_CAERE|nr:hypothetical protein GCK72_007784 [Caenorhabditis remanei]KAF1767825.1 hypothetical protein GCK72_007784 [Caenorhabditis remanei]
MDNSPANFQCDTCQKTFARLFDLNDHAVVHADERPFECEICDQKFKTKSSLRDHETVHEELTPYECSICRTPIRWKSFIRKHIHRQHNLTGEQLEYAVKWTVDTFSTERLNHPDTQRAPSSTKHDFQPNQDRISAKKRRRVDEDTEMDDINSNAPAAVTKINAALQNMKLEKISDLSEGTPHSRNNTPEPDQSVSFFVIAIIDIIDIIAIIAIITIIAIIAIISILAIIDIIAIIAIIDIIDIIAIIDIFFFQNFTDDIQQICSQICRIGNVRPECQDSIRLVLFETIDAFASGRCNNDAAEFFRDMAEKYDE